MSFFAGAASLVEQLDKKLMVVLRDGRKIVGYLRSFDQFANIVLQDSVERVYVGDKYGDIPRGLFLIRGENVMLLGELDPEKEVIHEEIAHQVPVDEILVLQQSEAAEQGASSALSLFDFRH